MQTKEPPYDLLKQSEDIFSLASSKTLNHVVYYKWQLKMELIKSLLEDINDPQQLRTLYGTIFRGFPIREVDLFLLASFDGVLGKIVEQWFASDVVRGGMPLREFIDSLNEVHLSVLDDADGHVSRPGVAADSELFSFVFDRIFRAVDRVLDVRYDHSADARRHRISHWMAPVEARLQRKNPLYDIGSYRSFSTSASTVAIDRLLRRIDFSVAGLNSTDRSAYPPANLAHFAASLLRDSAGMSDEPKLLRDLSDRTLFEMRRALSLRLAPLLQPLCEIEASFNRRRPPATPGMGLLTNVLSSDQRAVATNTSIFAEDCVAALILDWALQEDMKHMRVDDSSFSETSRESLDDIELRHEGQRIAKTPTGTSLKRGGPTTADRIAAIPMLIPRRHVFRGGIFNDSKLLLGPQGLALLSLPGHLRESVAFASRDTLKRLCRHFQKQGSVGLREGVDVFALLEKALPDVPDVEASVALDMSVLGVTPVYGPDGASWIRDSNPSDEEQMAAAVLLSEGLRSAAIEKIRALNLYNNFREDLVELNRDSQYAAHLLIALVRFFDMDDAVAQSEDERFGDLLQGLVAQVVLDSVFAAPAPEKSARKALYRATLFALHLLTGNVSVQRAEVFTRRLKKAESAVSFILLRDEAFDFDAFHDQLLCDATKWALEDAIALLPSRSDAVAASMTVWRNLSRSVLSHCLDMSPAAAEAKIQRQLGEAFDERTTSLLLDRSITADFGDLGIDITEELERQLLQLFPTTDGEPPVSRLDKLHQRVRLLAAEVSASLLSMLLVERSAGNANRAELLERRWCQFLRHPLLARSCQRVVDVDGIVLDDTLEALLSRWRSQNEQLRRKLKELLAAVEVALRSPTSRSNGVNDGASDRTAPLLLEKLHRRLLQEYARLALQQE